MVFEQEGGHVGQAVGENRASSAVFLSPKTNTHLQLGGLKPSDPGERATRIRENGRRAMTTHGMRRKDSR